MEKVYLFLFLLLFVFGCAGKPPSGYTTIQNKTSNQPVDEKQLIDVTEFIERNDNEGVGEFKGGQWAIAVHSDKTGYTYFYDDSNKLLGKRSEFAGNPRQDLIQERFRAQ
ncbi:MAG: hypothetical protein KJ977_05160 [Candidatus Omnitrophica bacterium]|nr:hypothetical protein [Candidatus Omnitrophota bacterium]MBU2266411.1 hypothetical protein [Candidatus Omnitrophota bacterium]